MLEILLEFHCFRWFKNSSLNNTQYHWNYYSNTAEIRKRSCFYLDFIFLQSFNN